MTAAPNLCLWRRNFCAAGDVLLLLQRCDFWTVKKPFPLTTAAQNIHVFLPKLPLHKKHFFGWLKAANFSIVCGTVTLKSPPSRGTDAPRVHPRPRKRLSRCTLDCGFKTSESPALRGFVAERGQIRGTSLYLVLKSNGPRSLSLPKVSTTRPSEKNRTQRLTRRSRGVSDGGAVTLGTNRTFPNLPWPGIRTANFAAFGSWSGVLPKHAGVAAPLGCVIFFAFIEIAACTSCAQGFLRIRGRGGITTLGVLRVLPKRAVRRCQNG